LDFSSRWRALFIDRRIRALAIHGGFVRQRQIHNIQGTVNVGNSKAYLAVV
jgi:hypothetical protein